MKRLLALATALALLLLSSAVGLAPAHAREPDPMDSPSSAEFDQEFLQMMIRHHQMAIMMAQPVQERASHPELRQLAGNIVTSQSAEIEQMQTWLRQWYGSDLMMPSVDQAMPGPGAAGGPGGMPHAAPAQIPLSGGMMPDASALDMMQQMVANLPANRLEAAFLSMMILHHQEALEMAQMALERASHEEVRQLAQSIIAEQAAEIRQMNQWLGAWYNL